jgi:hypothetical protein
LIGANASGEARTPTVWASSTSLSRVIGGLMNLAYGGPSPSGAAGSMATPRESRPGIWDELRRVLTHPPMPYVIKRRMCQHGSWLFRRYAPGDRLS